jgi:hypothetical protein
MLELYASGLARIDWCTHSLVKSLEYPEAHGTMYLHCRGDAPLLNAFRTDALEGSRSRIFGFMCHRNESKACNLPLLELWAKLAVEVDAKPRDTSWPPGHQLRD